jgi:hypothetical protein
MCEKHRAQDALYVILGLPALALILFFGYLFCVSHLGWRP